MKYLILLLSLCLSLIFISSATQVEAVSLNENIEVGKKYDEEPDSILLKALDIAKQQKAHKFEKIYLINIPDEKEVVIEQDYFLSDESLSLIVRRLEEGTKIIDIFFKKGEDYHKVLSHDEWIITYMGDTIFDVNGDGYKDFIVNGYGANGCCLKAYSLVYLFLPDSLSFSHVYDFLNPTFSPKEKLVRGVCYGHPGETELYKYKWTGERVDTIEYVSYEKDEQRREKAGNILISTHSPYDRRNQILKRLKNVPQEYTTIYGYDWFTGDIVND